ncbi:MAG: hypothetical protein HGB34_02905 [Candidatus Moranbacteria bacterium]|nr:hypothetical protein [Candidatus Moranbacteria bacterium]
MKRHPKMTNVLNFMKCRYIGAIGNPVPLLVGLSFLIALSIFFVDPGARADEGAHLRLIKMLHSDTHASLGNITNVPGFHHAVTVVTRSLEPVFHFGEYPKRSTIRIIVYILFGPAFIVSLFGLSRALYSSTSAAMSSLTFPVIFPFIYLVYTDIPALTFIIAAIWAHLLRRNHLAAGLIAVAFLMRQDAIIWIIPLFVLSCESIVRDANWRKPDMEIFLRLLRVNATYIIVGILFVGFLVMNGGVAVGDKSAHPSSYLGLGNFYYFLMISTVLFAPLLIGRVSHVCSLLYRRWRIIVPALFFGWFIFLSTFATNHPYNGDPRFLHNLPILFLRTGTGAFVFGYLLAAYAVLAFLTVRFIRHRNLVFAGTAIVAMLPHWMLEPRYSMAAFLFVPILFRWPKRLLRAQFVYGSILTATILFSSVFHAGKFI